MLCTIIRQIAVEINSNYGPGFKSIIFLFVLKYPWVQLWSLALFSCIISLHAAGEERAPTHLCVLHLCSLNNTKCICMDIFKCYLIHQGCINTKCKIPVRKSRIWCYSCSTSPTRIAYMWVLSHSQFHTPCRVLPSPGALQAHSYQSGVGFFQHTSLFT